MDHLWAPWRGAFIHAPPPDGCIFCRFPAEEGRAAEEQNLILGRSRYSFAILNKYPYNNGHLMVIPRRHTADFAALPAEESADLTALLQQSLSIVAEAYAPHGFNLGMNLGKVAGAGIADHLHWHLVPRWGGDSNFMPVVAETKVLIEHLGQTYEKLRPAFERALAAPAG